VRRRASFPRSRRRALDRIALSTGRLPGVRFLTAYTGCGRGRGYSGTHPQRPCKVVDLAENPLLGEHRKCHLHRLCIGQNVVGFQINGTSDDMRLDGLPGLAD